jgi:NADH-quinone oxidoreductase subunit J
MDIFVFVIAAAALLVSSGAVILARSPLKSALALICALCFLAVLFVLLDASFVAAMQVLVYAGAILVLFVFVIMLLNLQPGNMRQRYLSVSKVLGGLAALYFSARIAEGAFRYGIPQGVGKPIEATVKVVGQLMMTQYLFAFEAIGVLLLVAIVGPVVLGMKRLQ